MAALRARFRLLIVGGPLAALGAGFALSRLPSGAYSSVVSGLAAVTAALFVAAAMLRLTAWRLTGDARVAWRAAALACLGVMLPVVAVLAPALQAAHLTDALLMGRLVLVLPVLAMLVIGGRTHPIERGPRLLSPAPALLVCAALVLVVLAWRESGVLRAPVADSTFWLAAESVLAALWTSLAANAYRDVAAQPGSGTLFLRPGWLALMAVDEGFRAYGALGVAAAYDAAVALQVIAAGAVVITAKAELWGVISARGAQAERLHAGLDAARQRLVAFDENQRERLHDARSAMVGVMGASKLLGDPVDDGRLDQRRLLALMTAELRRLELLLDPDRREPVREFSLSEAIAPVVLAHRLSGHRLRTDLRECVVIGRPGGTATVIANLLSNVRAHAPGADVLISAEQHGDTVVVRVDDTGPGISPTERERLLLRGVRLETAGPGSGLGLYNAAAMMREQGGSLSLDARPGGGTRVLLRLPARAPVTSGAPSSGVLTARAS